MLHDLIVYAGWSMGETYMVIGVPLIFAVALIGGAVADHWSRTWANRISGYAMLMLVGWVIFALMLWNEPWVFTR